MMAVPLQSDDFSFGRSSVVPARRELSYNGVVVEIGDRAFELLLALISARGSVVSKDQLMALVWPGRIIEENTLESQISILRRALGDDRNAIRTVTGRGYQFIGELNCASPPSASFASSNVPIVSLPARVSTLIGRDRALREVTELTASYRLITLVGAGGVGKTRLAIESARQLAPHFPDRVCVAELASTASIEFLPTAVAWALGFPPGEGTPSLDRITASIRDKHILLVLDNCEHVIEGAARITESLLRASLNATVIATSREALRIPGEYVYRVPSLDVPPDDFSVDVQRYGAIQLLRERVGLASFNASSLDHVFALEARICRQLDGIPLAIELAAARVPVFGLQGVADRLGDRFQLLTQGVRTALPRQQTLRATLDWSYELLSASEQVVLNRLSIFANDFSIESAQAVVSTPDIPTDMVAACVVSLFDKSLVSPGSTGGYVRYRLLETTRAYAREKLLASGELHDLSGRHARYYLVVFQHSEREADSRSDIDWNVIYGPHLEDLRSAVGWGFSDDGDPETAVDLTIASVPLSMQLALLEECLARVDASLEWLDSQNLAADERRMKLYAARGSCLLYQSAGQQTGAAFKAALALAEKLGNVEYQMRGIWGCWCYVHLNGFYAETMALAHRFGKLASSSEHSSDQLVANRLLGISHLFLGELDKARRLLELALSQHLSSRRVHRIRFVYDEKMLVNTSLSHTLLFMGLPDQAMRTAEHALENARELDHLPSICLALSEAVCVAALTTGSEAALENAVIELRDATRRHGVSTWKARGRMWHALLQMRAGDGQVYERVIQPALDEIGGARFFVALTPFLSAVSQALGAHGRMADAMALIDPAIERARESGDECSLVELMRVKGELLLTLDAADGASEAERLIANGLSLAHRRSFLAWELRCAISLAALWHRQGRSPEAKHMLLGVYDRFSEGRGTADLVAARNLIATVG